MRFISECVLHFMMCACVLMFRLLSSSSSSSSPLFFFIFFSCTLHAKSFVCTLHWLSEYGCCFHLVQTDRPDFCATVACFWFAHHETEERRTSMRSGFRAVFLCRSKFVPFYMKANEVSEEAAIKEFWDRFNSYSTDAKDMDGPPSERKQIATTMEKYLDDLQFNRRIASVLETEDEIVAAKKVFQLEVKTMTDMVGTVDTAAKDCKKLIEKKQKMTKPDTKRRKRRQQRKQKKK